MIKPPRVPSPDPESVKREGSLDYALITPARNEEKTIEITIRSVIAQSMRPAHWVIVDDGSTDRTGDIVTSFSRVHSWIESIRAPEHQGRDFSGKAAAFNYGYARLRALDFDLIGNLDADVSFDATFFEFLLARFQENPRLGVGGAPFMEDETTYDYRFSSTDHVSGACQLFRRRCLEDIGGYMPIRGGGIDVVAVLSARMKGWETRAFVEKSYVHHRKMGTAKGRILKARYRDGKKDHMLGSHPLWEVCRSFYQFTRKPYVLAGTAVLLGFASSFIKGNAKPISAELVAFRRHDEMRRLREFIRSRISGRHRES